MADNTAYKYYGQPESALSQTKSDRIRFPIASVFFLLLAFLWIVSTIIRVRLYGSNSSSSNDATLNLIFLVARLFVVLVNSFVAVVLLLKRRGVLLTVAVIVLTAMPIFSLIISLLITYPLLDVSLNVVDTIFHVVFSLPYPYLLLLGLALYCRKTRVLPINEYSSSGLFRVYLPRCFTCMWCIRRCLLYRYGWNLVTRRIHFCL